MRLFQQVHFDTIIIGAGTAGLAAGRVLEEKHKDYVIIDRKKAVGIPIRSTGGVAKYFIDKLGMPSEENVISSEIRSISLRTDVEKQEFNLHFDHPVGYVYNFTKYEQKLAEDLKIVLNRNVMSIHDGQVFMGDDRLEADNIVVATGPQSSLVPYHPPSSDVIIAYEETRKLPKRTDEDLVIWFSKYSSNGYLWDFPSHDGRRIGLGYPRDSTYDCLYTPKARLDAFTNEHPELKGEIDHMIAHQIQVGRPMKRPIGKSGNSNVFYIGEAAGTTFASTGGGLQGAFWSVA